jgi:transposase
MTSRTCMSDSAIVEKTLKHEAETVREFYAASPAPVVVGLEATGSMGWFLQLLDELGITYRVGHPAMIRKAETRKQKHDRRDAALLLQLLTENRFPAIWMPSTQLRDLRALLLHPPMGAPANARAERVARDRPGFPVCSADTHCGIETARRC